jgi:hypothetical protein
MGVEPWPGGRRSVRSWSLWRISGSCGAQALVDGGAASVLTIAASRRDYVGGLRPGSGLGAGGDVSPRECKHTSLDNPRGPTRLVRWISTSMCGFGAMRPEGREVPGLLICRGACGLPSGGLGVGRQPQGPSVGCAPIARALRAATGPSKRLVVCWTGGGVVPAGMSHLSRSVGTLYAGQPRTWRRLPGIACVYPLIERGTDERGGPRGGRARMSPPTYTSAPRWTYWCER